MTQVFDQQNELAPDVFEILLEITIKNVQANTLRKLRITCHQNFVLV